LSDCRSVDDVDRGPPGFSFWVIAEAGTSGIRANNGTVGA
jgi:hypothetical protein